MSFFKSLFSKDSEQEYANEDSNKTPGFQPQGSSLYSNIRKMRKLQRFRFTQNSQNATAPAGNSSASGAAGANATKQMEDWLQISSYEFDNIRRYPPINLPNSKQIYFKTTPKDKFLINEVQREKIDPTGRKQFEENEGIDFYFRLNGHNLYWTAGPEEINVLGNIELDFLSALTKDADAKNGTYCMTLDDKLGAEYKVCAHDAEFRKAEIKRDLWYCRIANLLLIQDMSCVVNEQANFQAPPITIDNVQVQPIILIPEPAKQCNENWGYSSRGNDWECICAEGREQSPINIETAKVIKSPAAPVLDFQEVEAISPISSIDGQLMQRQRLKIQYDKGAMRIFNPYFGKIVTLDGTVYHVEEILFHTPAEHTIDGVRHSMEVQAIGYGVSKGDIGKQVVLSFLFTKKPGVYNRFIEDIDFFNLPNRSETTKELKHDIYLPKILFSTDSKEIITMKPFSFFTYQGSITFPPCTERTIHFVAKDPIPIGSTMFTLLKEAVRNNEDQIENDIENIRETQPLNDRMVFYYDASNCKTPSYPTPKVVPKGHYEKIHKTVTEYFQVNDIKPSGLPNSYVVSPEEAKGMNLV